MRQEKLLRADGRLFILVKLRPWMINACGLLPYLPSHQLNLKPDVMPKRELKPGLHRRELKSRLAGNELMPRLRRHALKPK